MKESEARRYPPGREFYFDFSFSSEANNSEVLKGDFQVGELDYLLENKEKRLQMLEDDLQDYIAAHKLSRQTAFNKGQKYIEDERSREKRVTLEAKIDVVKWEISELEEAIEKAEAEKKEKEIPPCLPQGPGGGPSHMPGSMPAEHYRYIDGQTVEFIDGLPVITDSRSVFRGLAVIDYTEHVVKPWLIACSQYRTKVSKEGRDLEVNHVYIRGSIHVPWPEFPSSVKRYLSNGQASLQRTSKPTMFRRTKY